MKISIFIYIKDIKKFIYIKIVKILCSASDTKKSRKTSSWMGEDICYVYTQQTRSVYNK